MSKQTPTANSEDQFPAEPFSEGSAREPREDAASHPNQEEGDEEFDEDEDGTEEDDEDEDPTNISS